MKDRTSYFEIVDQIVEIRSRIKPLDAEQRLITEQFDAGSGDADILGKDLRLQHEISRLLDQLDKKMREAQIIFEKD